MNGRGNAADVGETVRANGRARWWIALLLPMLWCLGATAARAATGDPLVVISVTAGGTTNVCDTPPLTGCLTVGEEDLIICKPTSTGLPITGCDWSQLLDGAATNLSINEQLRAVDFAPNGNITFVELNDDTAPGIGTIRKQDIVVLNPTDVLKPFTGGGPYDGGVFKLYLNGDLTLEDDVVAKPWDALSILKDGSCEGAISATSTASHTCPIIGSLTGGSGTNGLGGVHFENEDLLRCIPTGWAANGAVEACDFAMFFEADQLNGGGAAGITSDVEAIDILSFDPATMSGEMVFKKASGNPTGFPPHTPGKDLLLYDGTFGNGNCSTTTSQKCADDNDCPGTETCNTGTCTIGATPCASDGDCPGSGNTCTRTRTPVGTVTKFFDGVAVGLTGTAQNIEAFAVLTDDDGDGVPGGLDNCPNVSNPPSVCSGPGPETCPGGLSSECPSGETCVQPDSDQDGVGDDCEQCIGRPDPGTCDACPAGFCPPGCMGNPANDCTCGDGILDLPSEQCDLGSQNGIGPCTNSCTITGKCKGSGATCQLASDCPPGQGCCGNDIVEANEACDDGNVIENDPCTSACDSNPLGTPILGCEDLTGPNVIPMSIKPNSSKFKDTPDIPDFDRWKTKGEATFASGLDIDPDTQNVTITYNNNPSGLLFQSTLHPGDCNPPLVSCFVQSGSPTKPKWKFLDKEADIVAAPSWRKGKVKVKNNKVTFNTDGRNQSLFTTAELGVPPGLRQTLRIGNVCITGLVQCVASGNGKSQKCSLIP
jgi:cysteine-rich repeat protein